LLHVVDEEVDEVVVFHSAGDKTMTPALRNGVRRTVNSSLWK
jgi:hypothetical protein